MENEVLLFNKVVPESMRGRVLFASCSAKLMCVVHGQVHDESAEDQRRVDRDALQYIPSLMNSGINSFTITNKNYLLSIARILLCCLHLICLLTVYGNAGAYLRHTYTGDMTSVRTAIPFQNLRQLGSPLLTDAPLARRYRLLFTSSAILIGGGARLQFCLGTLVGRTVVGPATTSTSVVLDATNTSNDTAALQEGSFASFTFPSYHY